MKKRINSETGNLRQKAEELLKKKATGSASSLSEIEMLKLIHELEVHQIELEMQNEELIHAYDVSMFDLKKKNDESLEQQALFTSALDAIADVILYNEEPEDILENANRILGQTLQLDRSVIYQVSFEKNQITGLCEWLQTTSPEITSTIGNYPFDWFRCPLSELKKTQNYLISQFNAVNEHFIEDGSGIKLHQGMNIKSLLWHPFDFDEHRFYVFTLNQVLKQRQWTNEDISFVSSVAKQVSIALLKIRLLNEHKLVKESEEKLKVLSDQLESILDHIPGLVFYKDKKNNFIRVNKYFADAIHKNKHELTNVNLADIYPASIAGQYYQDDLSVINSGLAKLNIEEIWETEEGLKWVNTSKIPFIDANGEIIGVIGISMDITERRKAEQSLRESELRFRNLFDKANEGLVMLSIDGKLVEVNESFADMHGYTVEELKNTNIQDIDVLREGSFEGRADIMKRINAGEVVRFEVEHYHKDGHSFFLSDTASLITIGDQKFYLAFHQDITERKQAEETLQNKQILLRAIIDNIPYQIYCKDKQGRFLLCNPAVALNCGANTTDEMIGKTDFNFFQQHLAKQYFDDEQSIMQSGISLINHEEICINSMSDDVHWNLTTKIPFIDTNGIVKGLIGINRDITDRKKAEAQIKLKNEELSKINSEKDRFFSIIAHDLRGPFNGFLGLSKLMTDELPDLTQEEIQKMAGSMRDSATNLFNLLETLLEWSRMQQGGIIFNPESAWLMSIMNKSMLALKDSADAKGVEIRFDIPSDLKIFADEYMLGSIIRNLTSNAVKFTRKGGKVTISAKSMFGNSVEISVRDTGIGMNPEMVDDLFRLDVQTNRRGTENEPSSGLGLLLCKDFVEKHGGKIWVESEEGKGSCFYFTLPANRSPK